MLELNGRDLELEDVERVACDPAAGARLGAEARERVRAARDYVERLLDGEGRIYGVTTGFGRLAEVVISPEQRTQLQRNLVRSHAAGTGRPLSREQVRCLMVLRANALAAGHSGCRPEVIELLLELLSRGVHPCVPEAGSVGASGDLAPLAHIALGLMGEGDGEADGRIRPMAELLAERGLEPLELGAKEGLALINGTQATTGVGILAFLRAERALETAEVAGATSLEGLRGTPEAFRPEVHRVRRHDGQRVSGDRLTTLLRDSQIRESHRHGDPRIQDAYSLRCMPQVHGAAREILAHVRRVLEREANAVTDNPLIFTAADLDGAGAEEGAVISAGNFHAQVVANALDFLAIALANLAAISERRIERMLNPDLSGLPAFLTPEPGIRSGLMIAQVTAADLLGELRVLAHPASVDSVPTSANQEDHVSMGLASARKVARGVECLEAVLAIELMCGCQALEFLKPLRPGRGVEAAYEIVRAGVEPLDEDRVLSADIETMVGFVREGRFSGLHRPGPEEEEP